MNISKIWYPNSKKKGGIKTIEHNFIMMLWHSMKFCGGCKEWPRPPRDAFIGAAVFWKWCSNYAVNEPLNFRSYWTRPCSWTPWDTLHLRLWRGGLSSWGLSLGKYHLLLPCKQKMSSLKNDVQSQPRSTGIELLDRWVAGWVFPSV